MLVYQLDEDVAGLKLWVFPFVEYEITDGIKMGVVLLGILKCPNEEV